MYIRGEHAEPTASTRTESGFAEVGFEMKWHTEHYCTVWQARKVIASQAQRVGRVQSVGL